MLKQNSKYSFNWVLLFRNHILNIVLEAKYYIFNYTENIAITPLILPCAAISLKCCSFEHFDTSAPYAKAVEFTKKAKTSPYCRRENCVHL